MSAAHGLLIGSGCARRRLLVLLATGLLSFSPLRGEERDFRDIQLALYARRALLQDQELAPLNLGVRVEYGEATLWGTVPSRALEEKALKLVGKVQGIYKVRSDLRVVSNGLAEALRKLLDGLAADGVPLDLFPGGARDSSSPLAELLSPPGESTPSLTQSARPEREDSSPVRPL